MSATNPSYPRYRSKRLSRLAAVVLTTVALAAVFSPAIDAVLQRNDRAARDRELHDAMASEAARRLVDLFATHH